MRSARMLTIQAGMYKFLSRKRNVVILVAAVVCFIYLVSKIPTRGRPTHAGFPFRRTIPRSLEGGHATGRIPPIIHQTWKTGEVPELFKEWINSWLDHHPDWEYWFWTDSDIRDLVRERYPELLALFDGYPTPGYRADAFRYFVLSEFGGVYADIDVECLRPLDDVINQYDCFLSQEPTEHAHFIASMDGPLVSNALMGCRPGHPFFKKVINDLHKYSGWWNWNDILHATGPFMLTEVYHRYNRRGLLLSSESGTNPVHLAPPSDFQPTVDDSMLDSMREMCLHSNGHLFLSENFYIRQQELCSRLNSVSFQNKPPKDGYTNHHWTHTWAGRRHDPWAVKNSRRFFQVESLLQDHGRKWK